MLSAIDKLVISDPTNPTWLFTIDPLGNFVVNDIIHFSNEHNNKYVYLIRGGVVIFLADVITPTSIWPTMFPGDNNFAIATPSSFQWLALLYYNTYWGV